MKDTEIESLRARLAEAEGALRAIRAGEVDAVVVTGGKGEQVYSLKGADRVYRQLIESVSEGAATLSADGTILYGNAGLLKLLKRPIGKVLGTALRDCTPPAERDAIDAILAQARTEPIHHETQLLDSAGGLVPVYMSVSRIEVDGKSVFGVVLTDLTAQNSHLRIAAAQTALQESEQLYRSLFENMFNGFALCKIIVDDAGRPVDFLYLEVNGSFTRLTGLAEPGGKRASEIYPGIHEHSPELLTIYGRVAKTGKSERFNFYFKPLEAWLDISVYSVGNGYFSAVFDDISERRRAERELQESQSLMTSIVENAPLMIFIKEAKDLRFVLLNRGGEDLLGYEREQYLGKSNLDLYPPEQAAFFMAKDREVLDGEAGRADIPEEAVDTPHNGRRIVHTQKIRIKGPDGATKYLLGISEDITDRKLAEVALQKSAEEFRTLAEAMPQIVWITGADGKNIFFNQKWVQYTGMTLEASAGDGWNEPFHPDDRQSAWDAWQKATKERGIYSLETRLRRADGVYRWWLVRGVPLVDAGGKILKWYGTCTDIHDIRLAAEERISLQNQLAQSQKMESVGRLAGGVAHDFNNLLTAINGYAGFVLQALAPDDPTRKDVEEIIAAGQRAGRLTKQLLAFSRKQILNPQILDINEVVGATATMLKRLIGEDIRLETRLDPSACRVKVDAGQIEQVLLNLAVNARDAMPKGGTLTFETKILENTDDFSARHPDLPRGPIVCLCARDTGCGMTEEVRTHLFEPFFTTKEKGKGTGLGLSMVYGIIKQSGGDIEVESAPDRGTTFQIYFPQSELKDDRKDKQTDAGTDGDLVLRGNETILLVEDEETVRRLAQRALSVNGYTVLGAGSGDEALKILERRGAPVDLLITDVVMPGMSGRELARKIAAMNLARRTLFVSGYTDEAIVHHGILEPGLAFLNKPFTPDALLRKLREVLDGPANQAKA